MCVKPMEENEEDKVVSMIINYFTARVNMHRGRVSRVKYDYVCHGQVEFHSKKEEKKNNYFI